MKIYYSISFIHVIGNLWMGGVAATEISINKSDIDNMTDDELNITRESVENWLSSHSGDFSSIIDFYADIETGKDLSTIIEWKEEESEATFNACMFHEFEE